MADCYGLWIFRAQLQIDEALGPVNRWFCSIAHGYEVTKPELLLEHYIKNGGAADFAERFTEAMGSQNRWYCSEHYRCKVEDPRLLWDHYMQHAPARMVGKHQQPGSDHFPVRINIAC